MREKRAIPYRTVEKAMEPVRSSAGAAGWDLYTIEDEVLFPYRAIIVPTGIKAALPEGTVLLILPRSGYSIKNQIIMPNSTGVIDEDYRGTIGVPMMWAPPIDEHLKVGPGIGWREGSRIDIPKFTRIAQAILMPYLEQDWRRTDELSETARGEGGFGHTGYGAYSPGTARHSKEIPRRSE